MKLSKWELAEIMGVVYHGTYESYHSRLVHSFSVGDNTVYRCAKTYTEDQAKEDVCNTLFNSILTNFGG
jgi:hypothetical protein